MEIKLLYYLDSVGYIKRTVSVVFFFKMYLFIVRQWKLPYLHLLKFIMINVSYQFKNVWSVTYEYFPKICLGGMQTIKFEDTVLADGEWKGGWQV